jgi:hypothetical protein
VGNLDDMTTPAAERARRRVEGEEELELEDEGGWLQAPYAREAVDYLAVTLFAGLVLAMLGVAAAVVAWSWGFNG